VTKNCGAFTADKIEKKRGERNEGKIFSFSWSTYSRKRQQDGGNERKLPKKLREKSKEMSEV
jgi:hypothetical protein